MRVALSGNSPGELWGWIRPLVFSLREQVPGARITLFLFPCPYATGKEEAVAREMIGIDDVLSPRDSVRFILTGKNRKLPNEDHSVLIHCGGDLLFAHFLSRRLKSKTYAYQWGNKMWDKGMSGYFVSHEKQKEILVLRGISPGKIRVVGDLVSDGIHRELSADGRPEIQKERFLVTLFPGSRRVEVEHMLPYFLRVAEVCAEKIAGISFALAASPFVSDEEIAAVIRPGKPHILESSGGTIVKKDGSSVIRTERGIKVSLSRGNQYRLMRESDCVITIPGTKSGEAGMIGTPMIVALPTNRLEVIPYPGIPHLLEKIPLAGPRLKRLLMKTMLPKVRFLAQPNLRLGEKIVPEIVGELTPAMVADPLILILSDSNRRSEIREKLLEAYRDGVSGGSNRIWSEVGAL